MKETNDARDGGLLKGDSHDAPSGGMPTVITNQGNKPILVEGEEVVINKKAVKAPGKKTLTGTNKEILHQINTSTGGAPILKDGGSIDSEIAAYEKDLRVKKEYLSKYEDSLKKCLPHQRPHFEKEIRIVKKRITQTEQDIKDLKESMAEGGNINSDIESKWRSLRDKISHAIAEINDKSELRWFERLDKASKWDKPMVKHAKAQLDLVKELKTGTKHEREHEKTIRKVYAHKISPEKAIEETAATHIKERPHYYEDLQQMEEKNKEPGIWNREKEQFSGNKVPKSLYERGDMVYSWQNPDYAAPVAFKEFRRWNANGEPHENDGWSYKVTLKDNEGYTRSSKWMGEDSLSKTKKDEYAKGGSVKKSIKECLIKDGDNENDYIVEGNRLTTGEGIHADTWEITELTETGLTVKHLPKSSLGSSAGEKTITYDQLREDFSKGAISITGINAGDTRCLNLCIKAIKQCLDSTNMGDGGNVGDFKSKLKPHEYDAPGYNPFKIPIYEGPHDRIYVFRSDVEPVWLAQNKKRAELNAEVERKRTIFEKLNSRKRPKNTKAWIEFNNKRTEAERDFNSALEEAQNTLVTVPSILPRAMSLVYDENGSSISSFDLQTELLSKHYEDIYENKKMGDGGEINEADIDKRANELLSQLKEKGYTERLVEIYAGARGNIKVRERIQANKGADKGTYSRYHMAANGDKSTAIKQNAYLEESDVLKLYKDDLRKRKSFGSGGEISEDDFDAQIAATKILIEESEYNDSWENSEYIDNLRTHLEGLQILKETK